MPSTTSESIQVVVAANPAVVLLEREKFDQLFAHIANEVREFQPDLTTETGRKAIASLAYKVARTKTAIDDAGKKLTEEMRGRIAAVDASRREIREKLDALKEEARRPLTEWEAAEEARLRRCRAEIEALNAAATVLASDDAARVREILSAVRETVIAEPEYREFYAAGVQAKTTAISALSEAISRLDKAEADARELAQLRAEADERRKRQEAEQKAAEAQRKEEERAAKLKVERERREAEERARLERVAKEAADAARMAAERKTREEAEAREREIQAAHEAELERERAARLEAEEAERKRRAEEDRAAEERRRAEAIDKARQSDAKLRAEAIEAAVLALVERGLTRKAADLAMAAIAGGLVPGVTLRVSL